MIRHLVSRKVLNFALLLVIIVLMVTLTVGAALAADPSKWRNGIDEAGAENRTGQLFPLPVQEAPTDGYLVIATPSFAVGTAAAVLIGTLPTGTHRVDIGALNDAVNVGNASVPTGVWPFSVASGSFVTVPVATLTPLIYVRPQTGTGTVYLRAH